MTLAGTPAVLRRNDVGVTRDFLPLSSLFHPDGCEAEVFGFPSIGHLPTPDDSLASRNDYDVAINPEIFNLSIKRGDY